MDKIKSKMKFCELIANCEKQIFHQHKIDRKQGKETTYKPNTLIAKFIDPKNEECFVLVGKKCELFIKRLGKTWCMNTINDFTKLINILF